ncbi:MAG: hypothetical protein ABSE53_16880 [Terracidiphilus sp.]
MDMPLRSVELTQVTEWEDGQTRSSSGDLAAEEPLQILACSELRRKLKTRAAKNEAATESDKNKSVKL